MERPADVIGVNRYAGKPHPVTFERSLYRHDLVFVSGLVLGRELSCPDCAMRFGQKIPGCSKHPCKNGAWVTEAEAVVLRLESA